MVKYPPKLLENLYKTILRIRLAEESLVQPILNGEIKCPVHLYVGEEAVAAGVCAHLTDQDYVLGTHRSHGHYLAKGGGLKEMIAEIYGKETGCARGRGGSMHVIDVKRGMLGAAPIVAGTVALALGSALASKIRKNKSVSVAFFGDGATGEGALHESLNFAALKKLPIVFACENNLYSTHLPISEIRSRNNIYELGAPYGIHYERVDGQDVIKVYEAGKKAVEFCRAGKGPVFLEFMTYRYRGHVGPDDNIQGSHTDIRSVAEVALWKKNDPIKNLEKIMLRNGFKEEYFKKVNLDVVKEIEAAHRFAINSPYPDSKNLNKYVFKR